MTTRGKVLVVEDVALIRVTTVEMVEQLGYVVLEALDAEEALAILKQGNGIEILLTDLGLPGMSGHQLVEEALRMNPALKIIIVSGVSVGEKDIHGASVLVKPIDIQKLRRVLEA